MKVTNIEKAPKSKILVYLDNMPAGEIDLETFYKNRIVLGDEMSCDDFDCLVEQSNCNRAKSRALFLLSKKSYTRKMLSDKLISEFGESATNYTLNRMQELNLLNDEDYARRFMHDLVSIKHYGVMRIKQELYMRGIDRETISYIIEEIDVDPVDEVVAILNKKYPHCLEDEKQKARAINGLMRLGYKYDSIKEGIKLIRN